VSLHTDTDAEVRPCAQCQSPVFDDELYCEGCGRRVADEPLVEQAAVPRRHGYRDEHDLGVIAGITDRGNRRHRNEDALAIAAVDGRVVAAVCDGVASTANPDQAARAAANTAFAAVEPLLSAPHWPQDSKLEELLGEAFDEAQRAVLEVPHHEPDGNDQSPSTTMVVAVAAQGHVTVANIGDSRAYWLSTNAAQTRLLTVDDSWAQERIAEGIAPEIAYADPDAHIITRWIGGEAESVTPTVVTLDVTEPGLLLVCSDGLWNYFEDPQRLLELIPDWAVTAPIEIARRLTDAALVAGGQDNITVVVAPVDPAAAGHRNGTDGGVGTEE
jgi:serine/threonine protein phosphatase PrpC